jgi:hypothetical protein
MGVRTIRVAQTIDRELETRWFKLPWYLTRWEFCYAAVATMSASLFIFMSGSSEIALASFAFLLPTGCWIMARWKKGNPEASYMWDTFYRVGLLPERERWLKRSRAPLRFVPDIIPARSLFAGTGQGGLAFTEPWQAIGLPTFCPTGDQGAARLPILPWRPLIRPRSKLVARITEARAPARRRGRTRPAWDEDTSDATRRLWTVRPTMAATAVHVRITDV